MEFKTVWDSFRAVSYGDDHMGAVVYVDLTKPGFDLLPSFGKPLIFSGVTINDRYSTVNNAEDIIAKIREQEKIKITDRDFYDLQTWKGYPGFERGQFILSKIHFKKSKEIWVKSWEEIKVVPENFALIFHCLIGSLECVNISMQR